MWRFTQTLQALRLPLLGVALAFCTKAVHAQPDTLATCRAIDDRLARFDCYESLEVGAAETDSAAEAGLPADTGTQDFGLNEDAGAPGQSGSGEPSLWRRLLPFGGDNDDAAGDAAAEASETAQAEPAVEPARPPTSDLATFGMSGVNDARLERDAAGREELVDRVAGLRMYGHKQWEITLESGQVWRQMLSKTYQLSVGDAVRISPVERGRYYRLTSPDLASFIQVGRID